MTDLDKKAADAASLLMITSATTVFVTVEVEGPDGSRRARKIFLPKELRKIDLHQVVVEALGEAVRSYDRLEDSGRFGPR